MSTEQELRDYTSVKRDCLLSELPIEEGRFMAALQHVSSLSKQLEAARYARRDNKYLAKLENELRAAKIVARAQHRLVTEYRESL